MSRHRALPALVLLLTLGLLPDPAGSGRFRLSVWPDPDWPEATPAEMDMSEALVEQARAFDVARGGSGMILREGRVVASWGSRTALLPVKSTTKSIGVTLLGLALQDRLVELGDPAAEHLAEIGIPPSDNAATGWLENLTLGQLASHSAGFDDPGGFADLVFEPGSAWLYSDAGANWLGDVLTEAYGEDLDALLLERVFEPLGRGRSDFSWRANVNRPATLNGVTRRELASGISTNVESMSRIGYLYLHNGVWDGQRLIPKSFVEQVREPSAGLAALPALAPYDALASPEQYGLLWWNNAAGTLEDVPTDAFWSWGLGESLIVVIPSLDIVVARAGPAWQSDWLPDFEVLRPFLEPIANSVSSP